MSTETKVYRKVQEAFGEDVSKATGLERKTKDGRRLPKPRKKSG